MGWGMLADEGLISPTCVEEDGLARGTRGAGGATDPLRPPYERQPTAPNPKSHAVKRTTTCTTHTQS